MKLKIIVSSVISKNVMIKKKIKIFFFFFSVVIFFLQIKQEISNQKNKIYPWNSESNLSRIFMK